VLEDGIRAFVHHPLPGFIYFDFVKREKMDQNNNNGNRF